MANKNIVSVMLEERSFAPPPEFTQQARLKPADVEKLESTRRKITSGSGVSWHARSSTGRHHSL